MKDEYDSCIVRVENLPTRIRGFCYHDDDGTAYIVLNARLPHEMNRKSYQHELSHIQRGEMYDENYHEYGE